ncbi:MAG: hypothetical protein Q4A29_08725 [Eubacteriales bacterium]|nr:hypothetical protein [Eubacteriales bacterium]
MSDERRKQYLIAIAGNTAASDIEGFVYMAMNSYYQACITFTSQNLGGVASIPVSIKFYGTVCGW